MTITLDDLAFLASDAGGRVLSRLADDELGDDHTLKLITALRRDLSPQNAGSALELARLRKKAVSKFGDDAAMMYFTREALEQASDPLIRQWRARNPAVPVVDAGCGIGADSLAFAQDDCDVIGLDIDPLRVAMARLNAEALGVAAEFAVADVREAVPKADLIFFDPARRDATGKRIFDVERYQPPLSTIRGWLAQQIVVKLSPGVDLAQLQPHIENGASISFVSVDGELKEAILSIDVSLAVNQYRAVFLSHHTHFPQALVYAREVDSAATAPISEPRGWLVEPDPAIIRAGLVADLALELGGAQLDPQIAYITTDTKPDSPWVRSWKIIDWLPFNLKKLRAYLRARDVGKLTVKKRGSAVTPEALIAKLKLNGSGPMTVVLTRCQGQHICVVCEDLTIERGG